MSVDWQLVIDCAEPARLVTFWTSALGYRVEDPPGSFDTWNAFYRSIGVPDDELPDDVDAADSIVDPAGAGPRIWFQLVPESKEIKNRLHIDLKVGGGRTLPLETRRERVDAEVERLEALGAAVLRVVPNEGMDHYAVTMVDPEGNEFCVA
jgi:catechol 2,3-dioxygenase-like lactoylglutathione lyase family enzyme